MCGKKKKEEEERRRGRPAHPAVPPGGWGCFIFAPAIYCMYLSGKWINVTQMSSHTGCMSGFLPAQLYWFEIPPSTRDVGAAPRPTDDCGTRGITSYRSGSSHNAVVRATTVVVEDYNLAQGADGKEGSTIIGVYRGAAAGAGIMRVWLFETAEQRKRKRKKATLYSHKSDESPLYSPLFFCFFLFKSLFQKKQADHSSLRYPSVLSFFFSPQSRVFQNRLFPPRLCLNLRRSRLESWFHSYVQTY